MKRRGLREQIKGAARTDAGYVLLTIFGVIVGGVQVFFTLPDAAELALFVVGSVSTLLGAAGFGAALGRERTDENLRLKLEPPYRRTVGLYDGISRVAWDLLQSMREILVATKPNGSVDAAIVRRGQITMETRLNEQVRTLDVALAEWRELVPEKVDETKNRLQKEGRLA